MKYLIAVVLICTLLLNTPFRLVNKSGVGTYSVSDGAKPVEYTEAHTKSLDKLLVNDIVIFGTDPPHFAKVDKQVDGELRGLKVIRDSIVDGQTNMIWAKHVLEKENLPYLPSNRLIDPNVSDELQSGEILVVYRKVKTNFYYRPIFEGVFGIALFFICFFGISIVNAMPVLWSRFIGLVMMFGLLLYLSFFRYNFPMIKYAVGDWHIRLAYWGVSMALTALTLYFVYKFAKRIINQYKAEALKFAAVCIVVPLSTVISFRMIELFYPELTLLALYENGNLDQLTIWSHYCYGYAFASASLLAFGIRKYRAIKLEKDTAVDIQLNTTAQLNSLQARLNPHFLYNSLNSIASLIKSEPDKAEEMTLSVSRFLKHFSNRESDHMTLLREEAEMIEEYLGIEKIRFGESLTYDIDIALSAYDKLVPRSLLQPLVENAIKYGFNGETQSIKLELNISLRDSTLSINLYDSGHHWNDNLTKGYGLTSVYDKLELLYGPHHEISFHNEPRKHITISIELDKLQVHD